MSELTPSPVEELGRSRIGPAMPAVDKAGPVATEKSGVMMFTGFAQ
ncbi:hypothetical protein [Rhizobium grahamii]|nr:hypothetical protein [Rhizobium grahamii]